MRNINKLLIGATVAGAAFATVGSGAGAVFLDTPVASQQVETGTVLISLSDGTNTATGTTMDSASLSLAPIGPTGSTFKKVVKITATNHGTVAGTITNIQLASTGDSQLAKDIHTTIYKSDWATQICSGSIAHCSGPNLTPDGSVTLAPNASVTLIVETYAGGPSGAPALTNIDEGRTINETLQFTVTG